jgi:putative glutamine amidotransferase
MTRKSMVIGVSKLSENYARWLNQLQSGLEIIDFYSLKWEDMPSHFQRISGLLLSGGGDIHPACYGREDDFPLCRGIDDRRDKIEAALIDLAFTFHLPVLGICRGLQILNVVKGGTLIADIPVQVNKALKHQDEKGDVHHTVTILPESALFSLTQTGGETVNSSHHQAIRDLAVAFRATAFSSDGIIEAIELKQPGNNMYCMAVQWHPERMPFENPLSGMLGRGFIEAAG